MKLRFGSIRPTRLNVRFHLPNRKSTFNITIYLPTPVYTTTPQEGTAASSPATEGVQPQKMAEKPLRNGCGAIIVFRSIPQPRIVGEMYVKTAPFIFSKKSSQAKCMQITMLYSSVGSLRLVGVCVVSQKSPHKCKVDHISPDQLPTS